MYPYLLIKNQKSSHTDSLLKAKNECRITGSWQTIELQCVRKLSFRGYATKSLLTQTCFNRLHQSRDMPRTSNNGNHAQKCLGL